MGHLFLFDATRRPRPAAPFPVALTQAWAAYCAECQAAWLRWFMTGR